MPEKLETQVSLMTAELFEKHHERVFSNGSPIDGLTNPSTLKEERRSYIAESVDLIRPKLIERFPALETVDPSVIDELAVYIGFFERGSLESGIRIGHNETLRRARMDPNSAENVLARKMEMGV